MKLLLELCFIAEIRRQFEMSRLRVMVQASLA